jgi:cell division septation protein DedD/nucleoid DNA-binding protein
MVGTVIKSLVSQGKRVIIPDFGAFLIKDSTLSIIIAKDNVTFSPFLKYNDGFLENELAQQQGLHKEDARQLVAAFVEAVKTSLNVDKKAYEIPGLGFFYKDKQGNAAFSTMLPSELSSVTPVTARLDVAVTVTSSAAAPLVGKLVEEVAGEIPTITFSPPKDEATTASAAPVATAKEEEEPAPANARTEKKVAAQAPVPPKKEEPVAPVGQELSRNPVPTKKSKPLLVGFILLVGALFALNFFWTDIFGTNADASKPKIVLDPIDSEQKEAETEKVEAKEVAQDAIDNEVVTTVEKTVTRQALGTSSSSEQTAGKATDTKNQAVKETVKATTTKSSVPNLKKASGETAGAEPKTYVVVLGSFETSENAEKHVANLAKKKVKGYVVHRSQKYSVVSASFKSYDEAQAESERIKALGVDGWISSK